MDELKPCPFCGRVGSLFVQKDKETGWYYMQCCDSDNGCTATGPIAMTEEEAVEFWNERKEDER